MRRLGDVHDVARCWLFEEERHTRMDELPDIQNGRVVRDAGREHAMVWAAEAILAARVTVVAAFRRRIFAGHLRGRVDHPRRLREHLQEKDGSQDPEHRRGQKGTITEASRHL
jgi:hypothetical protein